MLRESVSLGVFLHCRTVVEKQTQTYVTTGVITGVEGELFEIEVGDFQQFQLGEPVKLTIYSPVGIKTFQSVVFARYHGAIAVIQPPALQMKFGDKREHVRIETAGTVVIAGLADGEGSFSGLAEEPLECPLRDISVGGVGFYVPDTLELAKGTRLQATIRVAFEFSCELVVIRRDRYEDRWICGARILLPDEETLRSLRAFILRQQVDKYIRQREQSGKMPIGG